MAEATRLLDDRSAYHQAAHPIDVYGDGKAAKRIVAGLLQAPLALATPTWRRDAHSGMTAQRILCELEVP